MEVIYRVGVTGHRPPGLDRADLRALRSAIAEALRIIRDAVSAGGRTSAVRLISPLAEGADRLAAREALLLGFDLQCPFPFAAEEYERDSATAASVAELRELAAQASAVFEMDGSRADEPAAYEAAGMAVLNHSDLLLAIWDGQPAQGAGGTGQIVGHAAALGIPVLWIHSAAPHVCTLPGGSAEAFANLVARQIAFRTCPAGPEGMPAPASASVAQCYEWADRCARRYALLYRTVFRVNCVLGAAAVLFALFTYHWPHAHGWTIAELVLMLFVAFSVWFGSHGRWHDRWLDWRALAEYARALGLLQPLGAGLLFAPWQAHQPSGGSAWLETQVRRMSVLAGLPHARATMEYLEERRAALAAEIRRQIAYHRGNARRAGRVHRMMERLSGVFFVGAAAACALHLATGSSWFTLASAFFPVAGASLASVVMHGEFGRLARRSAAMADRLEQMAGPVDTTGLTLAQLSSATRDAAAILNAELADWAILFRARPLTLPS